LTPLLCGPSLFRPPRGPLKRGQFVHLIVGVFNGDFVVPETGLGHLAQLEAIYDSAPVGLCVLDRQLRYVRINRRLADMHGITAAAHIGRTLREIVPDLAPTAETTAARIFRTGEPAVNVELVGATPARPGVRRTWVEQWLPLKNAAGDVIGINVAVEEVTERKRLESQLRAHNAQLSELAEALDLGPALIRRLDGTILFWNTGAERLYGWSKDEALGRVSHTLLHTVHPKPLQEIDADLLRDGHWAGELRHRKKDGSVLWVASYQAVHYDENGAPASVVEVNNDITGRKEAEADLRQAAEFPDQNPQPVVRVSRDGTVLYANRGSAPLLRFWGCEVGRALPGSWADRIAAVASGGEIAISCEDRIFSCLIHAVPGKAYFNLYGRDVTDRQQAMEALQKARNELEQRVEERTAELLTTVHELKMEVQRRTEAEAHLRQLSIELTRTEQREHQRLAHVLHDGLQQLLVAARFRTTLLERNSDAAVQASARQLRDLLGQALDACRSLTVELNPPVLHNAGLVPGLEWLRRWMLETHQLTVELQVETPLQSESEPITILLFQAVRELLFNVVKHAGVRRASVTLRRTDDCIQVVVADEGHGFDPEQVRPDAVVGLGLPSIRQRLVFLGGSFETWSRPGQGSRFTLTVPVTPR
jgi:PAS domain S-box-containing protein